MININNLSIKEVEVLFSAIDFMHGAYPDIEHYKQRVDILASLKVRLQSLIEESEASSGMVAMGFCQYD
jgi:hypothetical protein